MIFINRKPKTLLIWAIILLALITLMSYQTDPSTNINDFASYTEKNIKSIKLEAIWITSTLD